MSSEGMGSSDEFMALAVPRPLSNDENDFHNPHTMQNLSTLNNKILEANISEPSSTGEVSAEALQTCEPVFPSRNNTASLLDDVEDEEDDTVHCEGDSSAWNTTTDDSLPLTVRTSNTQLLDEDGNVVSNPDNIGDGNTLHEEIESKSQDGSALMIANSSEASILAPFSNPPSVSLSTGLSTARSLFHPTPNWDNFVRSGARLKTLLKDAIGEVKHSLEEAKNQASRNKRGRDDDEDESSTSANQRSRVVTVADFSAELAREKTAQVLQLQRQLKDAQAQADAVQAANASLREETSSNQSRLDRTVEALRIASNNVAKARSEADAAEATAATLAQTLQNLQIVLTETKAASQILHKEQLQVNATVAVVESKLLQKEAEIVKAQKDLKSLRQANAELENSNVKLVKERDVLEIKARLYEQDLEELKREKSELAAIEKARKDRAEKVEQEWQKAQHLLVEATSGQAAAKQTQDLLEKTIESLKKSNEELHVTLKEQQRLAREYRQRTTESLGKAEKEVQHLRISTEATSEEMARLRVEKLAADTQIQQLKNRLASTERSLKAYSGVDPSTDTPASNNVPSLEASATTPTTTTLTPNQLCFQLPPLSTAKKATVSTPAITEKENMGVEKGDLCCMCYKPSVGIMKTCQCGSTTCHRKAHANCIKLSCLTPGLSVAHPGTPAPKLPVVLCDSVLRNIRASVPKT